MNDYLFFVNVRKKLVFFRSMSEQPEQVSTVGAIKIPATSERIQLELKSERDFLFQSVIELKNKTYKYFDLLRREIHIEQYLDYDWFLSSWNEIVTSRNAIIGVLSDPQITLKLRGVIYQFQDLKLHHTNKFHLLFADYLDGLIANVSEDQLMKLEDYHFSLNQTIHTLIGSILYDRASHG